MRRFPDLLIVSQALCADLNTRNLFPQYWAISGMNGRASRQPCESSVARTSPTLRTATQSPAPRPSEWPLSCGRGLSIFMSLLAGGFDGRSIESISKAVSNRGGSNERDTQNQRRHARVQLGCDDSRHDRVPA